MKRADSWSLTQREDVLFAADRMESRRNAAVRDALEPGPRRRPGIGKGNIFKKVIATQGGSWIEPVFN